MNRFGYYEFFAGGGMARLGLGSRWECLLANDFSPKKAAAYQTNFAPARELVIGDVRLLKAETLPKPALLAWASFPCQDLSLAGKRAGLESDRSGTFWPFWSLIRGLAKKEQHPPLIVLENVVGAITSNRGKDFESLCDALCSQSYRVGPLVIDGAKFLPQSRPRLFIVAVSAAIPLPAELFADSPLAEWHPKALTQAHAALAPKLKKNWIWWNLPSPPARRATLSDVIEVNPSDVKWDSTEETKRLIAQMSELNRKKLREAQKADRAVVGAVYKRTRRTPDGKKVQRAEVRFDDVSGCLRTPAGGSSRQRILIVNGSKLRSRLLSSREAARLMGVPDSYKLPKNYNEAYHLMGDGLVVPAVSWIEKKILRPIAESANQILGSTFV